MLSSRLIRTIERKQLRIADTLRNESSNKLMVELFYTIYNIRIRIMREIIMGRKHMAVFETFADLRAAC